MKKVYLVSCLQHRMICFVTSIIHLKSIIEHGFATDSSDNCHGGDENFTMKNELSLCTIPPKLHLGANIRQPSIASSFSSLSRLMDK